MADSEELVRSRRPDGTLRPAVRVRKGYVPPEEQVKYSDKWKSDEPAGIPGAEPDPAILEAKPLSKTAAKNKRRNERERCKKADDKGADESAPSLNGEATPAAQPGPPAAEGAGEPSEVEKKLKMLRKRLRQIDELEEKLMNGATLNPDQTAKVASKEKIEAEVAKWEALGDVDITKKVKNLKKKLRQIEELEAKAKTGEPLNQDQQEKIDHKQATVDELALLEGMANMKL